MKKLFYSLLLIIPMCLQARTNDGNEKILLQREISGSKCPNNKKCYETRLLRGGDIYTQYRNKEDSLEGGATETSGEIKNLIKEDEGLADKK